MVMKVDYFPPKGTKYEWHPPPLQHRPWWCRLDGPGYRIWDRMLNVGRQDDGLYWGYATIRTLQEGHVDRSITPVVDPLEALRSVEALADELLEEERKKAPLWAEEALKLRWRPPSQ